MAGASLNIQNKILTGAGVKPTIPTPDNITPDNVAWNNATDILIGQWAYNRTDDIWYYRSGVNTIIEFQAGQGNVSSVFGRNGAVIAEAGDYNAVKITFDPTGTNIIAVDVQGALEELDTELIAVENKADQNELDITNKADKGPNANTVFEATKAETFAASIILDLSTRSNFSVEITGNITIDASDLVDGQTILIEGTINTVTPPTITLAAKFVARNDAETIPNANGDRFLIVGFVNGTDILFDVIPKTA